MFSAPISLANLHFPDNPCFEKVFLQILLL